MEDKNEDAVETPEHVNVTSEPQENPSCFKGLKKTNVWDRAQTLLLIQKCSQRKDDLNNPRFKKMEIYKEIAEELQKFGHDFTYEQCINRMKTLLTKYKEVKDYNNKSGNSSKKWEYLDLMERYVGDRPGIMPTAPCSSLSLSAGSEAHSSGKQMQNAPKRRISDLETDSSSSVSVAQSCNMKDPKVCSSNEQEAQHSTKKLKIGQRNSPRVEMLKWLREYKEESKAREDKRLELATKQHDENKAILNEILNLIKK